MAANTITAADDPGYIIGVCQIDDAPLGGKTIQYRLVKAPDGDGHVYSRLIQTSDASDESGQITIPFRRGGEYGIRFLTGEWINFVAPTDEETETFSLPSITSRQNA